MIISFIIKSITPLYKGDRVDNNSRQNKITAENKTMKTKSKIQIVIEQMPPLPHKYPDFGDGKPFDYSRSAVVMWLINQPEFLRSSFDFAREKGWICYDSATKMWAGMAPKSAPKKNREPSIFTEASKDAQPSRESLAV